VLPLLYLHGLSSLHFGPALERFLARKREVPPGSGAGLSAATITRLRVQWQDEAFNASTSAPTVTSPTLASSGAATANIRVRLGYGGNCSHCDEPVSIDQLLAAAP